ncbi:50S ribosomal protein L15e [Candidatus Micrarchaeota archaeon]|nr:50S ribosomal protein L15e [Candidatus Micrarchaeota archaeon]
MGAYKYIQKNLEKAYGEKNELYKKKLLEWKSGKVIERVEKPANLPRARTLGYKAKNGYVIVRVRTKRGRRKRPKTWGGRKPKHRYLFVQPQLSYQGMAEQRANQAYKNLEVLNSYWIGEDGNYKFFEVILADPQIVKDVPALKTKGRVFRGLTSRGRKARGLHAIGKRKQRINVRGK